MKIQRCRFCGALILEETVVCEVCNNVLISEEKEKKGNKGLVVVLCILAVMIISFWGGWYFYSEQIRTDKNLFETISTDTEDLFSDDDYDDYTGELTELINTDSVKDFWGNANYGLFCVDGRPDNAIVDAWHYHLIIVKSNGSYRGVFYSNETAEITLDSRHIGSFEMDSFNFNENYTIMASDKREGHDYKIALNMSDENNGTLFVYNCKGEENELLMASVLTKDIITAAKADTEDSFGEIFENIFVPWMANSWINCVSNTDEGNLVSFEVYSNNYIEEYNYTELIVYYGMGCEGIISVEGRVDNSYQYGYGYFNDAQYGEYLKGKYWLYTTYEESDYYFASQIIIEELPGGWLFGMQ